MLELVVETRKHTIRMQRNITTRNWYKLDPPSLKEWLKVVGEIYAVEKFTNILRLKKDIVADKWEKLTFMAPRKMYE